MIAVSSTTAAITGTYLCSSAIYFQIQRKNCNNKRLKQKQKNEIELIHMKTDQNN